MAALGSGLRLPKVVLAIVVNIVLFVIVYRGYLLAGTSTTTTASSTDASPSKETLLEQEYESLIARQKQQIVLTRQLVTDLQAQKAATQTLTKNVNLSVEEAALAAALASQAAVLAGVSKSSPLDDDPSKQRSLYSFKVPEELEETHDVAIPRDIPPWTETDGALLRTLTGFNIMTELLKEEYSKNAKLSHRNALDMAKVSRSERVYKALWNHVYPIYEALPGTPFDKERALSEMAKTRADIEFFLKLEHKLFPWVHFHRKTSFSLYQNYKGKGYVLCAGNGQFAHLVSSVQSIREVLKSDLPIQVFYSGDSDLSPSRQAFVRDMTTNIEIIDINTIFDNAYMQLEGWSIKAFAILASRFEDAMLIDADVYFLREPSELFDDPAYKHVGALFFYDRTLYFQWKQYPDFMRATMPLMSSFPKKSRSFRSITSYEQESGVVVVNNKKRFLGMLAACKMNSKWERDLWSYKIFHGDKETFWIGFEMMQDPYAFVRSSSSALGEIHEFWKQTVCGTQLHLDYLQRPMWWNGGLMRNKASKITRDLEFKHWMHGGGMQKRRELNVEDPEMSRELLDDLQLQHKNQLDLEPGDPVWNVGQSCLSGGAIVALTEEERRRTVGFRKINTVAQSIAYQATLGRPIDPKSHKWRVVLGEPEQPESSLSQVPAENAAMGIPAGSLVSSDTHGWKAMYDTVKKHAEEKSGKAEESFSTQ
ncbi:hypothetical protein BGZ94_007629 [Podila epigama]|nr:hypothetical protein BGZ94_007629 [Podila epigama]